MFSGMSVCCRTCMLEMRLWLFDAEKKKGISSGRAAHLYRNLITNLSTENIPLPAKPSIPSSPNELSTPPSLVTGHQQLSPRTLHPAMIIPIRASVLPTPHPHSLALRPKPLRPLAPEPQHQVGAADQCCHGRWRLTPTLPVESPMPTATKCTP